MIAAVTLATLQSPAGAFERWRGDIRLFHRHDVALWRGGAWRHSWHNGHWGWWWVAAGSWYFYERPIYPYPDPYIPPTVVVAPTVVAPPAEPMVVQPAATVAMAPTPAQYWYYCKSPQGYYPYVASCASGWSQVPATPLR
jgi:hypothetical protein